jgi:5-methylcytosine-specific restriction protein A
MQHPQSPWKVEVSMPTSAPSHRSLHARSAAERNREHDRHRGSFRERGYDARWQKARVAFLRQHPLCVMCLDADRTTPATVVDHVVPHRSDQRLFWDESNWQSLCKRHHDRDKQRIERGSERENVRTMFPLPSST